MSLRAYGAFAAMKALINTLPYPTPQGVPNSSYVPDMGVATKAVARAAVAFADAVIAELAKE